MNTELNKVIELIKRLERNNYFVKVSRMKLAPVESNSIKAYFTASIGTINIHNWKLIESDNSFFVEPPSKTFVNSNGITHTKPIIEIFDQTIIEKVFCFAMSEYRIKLMLRNGGV